MPIAPSCLADRIEREAVNLPVQRWHLHRGHVQWFICGPGAEAMHPCSAPVYEGRHPTIGHREAFIAAEALRFLDKHHRQDRDLGPSEIQRILDDIARSYRHVKNTPVPSAHGLLDQATEEEIP